MKKDLEGYRKEIDRIDKSLINLLAKRMSVSKKIGKIKKELGLAPLDEKRWRQVMDKLREEAEAKKVDADFVEKIYELIHDESLRHQSKV